MAPSTSPSGSTATRPTAPATTRRPSLTGRAAVLAFVVGAVVVSLALPLREFFTQRAVLDDLESRTTASQARVDELTALEQRWRDPSFVKAQARERLHFVMPGEVGYVVLGGDEQTGPGGETSGSAGAEAPAWYDSLWQSVEAAGSTAAPSPEPVAPARSGAPR